MDEKSFDRGKSAILLSKVDSKTADTESNMTGHSHAIEGATALSSSTKATTHDNAVLVDQIKGVLYGNCVGDAIGLLTEFMNKKEAEHYYRGTHFVKTKLEYDMKVNDRHRCNWKTGDWTDDSDQMILILRTLVDNNGQFEERDFALKLKHWVYFGYPELGDAGGCGLGRTTASVLSHEYFLHNPHKAARDVWEGSGRFIAPNGGVMRTSVLGTKDFHDLDKVIKNTRNACMVTHADPRCIASCVAVTIAIALMLQRGHEMDIGKHDIEAIMHKAYFYAEQEIDNLEHHGATEVHRTSTWNERYPNARAVRDSLVSADELKKHMFATSLGDLELASQHTIGYTLKCMGAGFWALRQSNFREALQAITMEAGDADTNGAVAGALLGCKLGFKNLPKSWVDGLCNREWLDREIHRYLELLGLQQ